MSHLSQRLRHYQKCEGPTQDTTLNDAADRIHMLEKALIAIADDIDVKTSETRNLAEYYTDIVTIIRAVDPWRK